MIDALTTRFFRDFPDSVSWRTVGREAEHPLVGPDGEAADIARIWPELAGPDLQASFEGDLQVGLQGPDYSYSAEVGRGTIEIITAPQQDLLQLRSVYEAARDRLLAAADTTGISVLGYGIQPKTPASVALMAHKQRYHVLHEQLGDLWLWFALTASDQVHTSIGRQEAILVANAGNLLAPLIIALCANSPVHEGRVSAYASAREGEMGHIGADQGRHGMPTEPLLSHRGFIEQLVALRHLMHKREGTWSAQRGAFAERTSVGDRLYTDFLDHEHYVWHTARPRSAHGTLEIRAACQQPGASHDAAAALGVAIVAAAPRLMHTVSSELGDACWPPMRQWHAATIREGLAAPEPTPGLCQRLLQDCTDALAARGRGEEQLLAPLWDRLSSGLNPAQRAREVFETGGLGALVDHTRLR